MLYEVITKEFNLSRLERYLSIVYESGAMPVFVLTKSDIGEEIEKKVLELERIAFGAPIHVVNIFENETIEELRQYFKSDNTIALVGSSGVGKSTLINKLLGKDVQYTKEIRDVITSYSIHYTKLYDSRDNIFKPSHIIF